MRLLHRLPVTHKDGSVPHWHDNEQILVTVSGMCKLTIDGNIFDAHPGDLLSFLPAPAIARSARDRKAASITKSSRRPSVPTAGLDRTIGPALRLKAELRRISWPPVLTPKLSTPLPRRRSRRMAGSTGNHSIRW
ncbi:AraC family ligand binding domain-containing protein [Mesorhizobium sp.]|uniref:AraC family ligand binding domain-containing protein n=1 Tax=Mesorhizobium sp. TaxID=1871066 RepID=UPI003420DA24